jgi:hypothetical protein
MTCGDFVNGKFVKMKDPAEMQRRWNSFLTNVLSKRYRVGVATIEPHKDDGLHFHLVACVGADIRTGFDFEKFDRLNREVASGKRKRWRAAECGANAALSREWAFFRRIAERYGFGRCNIQPVRKSGDAVARYAAKYVTKGFHARRPEHKGMRMVRYFGDWQTREDAAKVATVRASRGEKPLKARPKFSARRGVTTPRARVWRECMKQVAFCSRGQIREDNVKQAMGTNWAWHAMKMMGATRFYGADKWPEGVRLAMQDHNETVDEEWLEECQGRVMVPPAVWERPVSDWLFDWHAAAVRESLMEQRAEESVLNQFRTRNRWD